MDTLNLALSIIKKLNTSGNSNYLVGGSVRDYLLNRPFEDIDIVSASLPLINKNLITNFDSLNMDGFYYGVLKYIINGYHVDITTLRQESNYIKFRRPEKVSFIKDIKIDSLRRDFTINALYMDINYNIYDFYDGKKHLEEKKIVVIGKVEDRMTEDPLRILRALRLVLKLDFTLEDSLKLFILKNTHLLKNIKETAINNEIKKIRHDCDIIKALELFKEYGLENYLKWESINE